MGLQPLLRYLFAMGRYPPMTSVGCDAIASSTYISNQINFFVQSACIINSQYLFHNLQKQPYP